MRIRSFVVLLIIVTVSLDETIGYDNYDYEEDYNNRDNKNSNGGNNSKDYNDGNGDNNGDKEQNQSDNNQKNNNDEGNGDNYNDDRPDPKQDRGPIQFPPSPDNIVTSGVVVGASGYGFKAPENFIGGHTYQWNDYK